MLLFNDNRFQPRLTTTIFDTKQPSLTAKTAKNEGLSSVATRWKSSGILIQCNATKPSVAILSRFESFPRNRHYPYLVQFLWKKYNFDTTPRMQRKMTERCILEHRLLYASYNFQLFCSSCVPYVKCSGRQHSTNRIFHRLRFAYGWLYYVDSNL